MSVVASLATLKILCSGGAGFYPRVEGKCQFIVKSLKKLIDEFGLQLQLNNIASMFQIFFTPTPVTDYKSVKTSDSVKFMNYHTKLLEESVFVPPSQFETCFLSNAHSEEDLKRTVYCLSKVLGNMK